MRETEVKLSRSARFAVSRMMRSFIREKRMKSLICGFVSAALLTIASTSDAQFVQRGAQTGMLPQAQRTEARCLADVRQLVTRWATPQTSNDQQNQQIEQIGSTLGCHQIEQQHSQPPYR